MNKYDDIPDGTIKADLEANYKDLKKLEYECEAFETLAKNSDSASDTRIYEFKAENRRINITELRKFIKLLEAILEYRKVNNNA